MEKVCKVSLARLRATLVLGNSLVLLAALVSLLLWLRVRECRDLADRQGEVLVHQVGRGRLEAVVLVSGLVLLVHWCLVGLLFPCLATPGTRTRVVALVHAFTLAVMVWEVCCVAALLRLASSLGTPTSSLDRLVVAWAPWVAASYLACLPVHLLTAVVPASLASLPAPPPTPGSWDSARRELDYSTLGPEQDLSYYITEMPGERLARTKAREAEEARVAVEAEQEARKAEQEAEETHRASVGSWQTCLDYQDPVHPFLHPVVHPVPHPVLHPVLPGSYEGTFQGLAAKARAPYSAYSGVYVEDNQPAVYLPTQRYDCFYQPRAANNYVIMEEPQEEYLHCSGTTPPPSYHLAVHE